MMSEIHLKLNAVEAKANARICVENNFRVYIILLTLIIQILHALPVTFSD